MEGCRAGRTGVAAVRVTVTHAGSHSGGWLRLAQTSGQSAAFQDCTASFENTRALFSLELSSLADLRQLQQVEGRCAKSGRSKALLFQKASLCPEGPSPGAPRWAEGGSDEGAERSASFFLFSLPSFPPSCNYWCVSMTQAFAGKEAAQREGSPCSYR